VCVIVESCFAKNKCFEKSYLHEKKMGKMIYLLSGGEEGDVLFQLFVCCFNCGTVAIGKNYREDDDDDERLDDFEGGKASKPF